MRYKSDKSVLKCRVHIHTGSKSYSCRHSCHYYVMWYKSDKSVLKCHVHIHTGSRSYSCRHSCHYCVMWYKSDKSVLKCHVHIHTGSKSYSCILSLGWSLAADWSHPPASWISLGIAGCRSANVICLDLLKSLWPSSWSCNDNFYCNADDENDKNCSKIDINDSLSSLSHEYSAHFITHMLQVLTTRRERWRTHNQISPFDATFSVSESRSKVVRGPDFSHSFSINA